MSRPIRVVLVEDNEVFREAVELLLGLRDDIQVVASVPDGDGAAAAAAELRPDVVLMDYRLPGLDGVPRRPVRSGDIDAEVKRVRALAVPWVVEVGAHRMLPVERPDGPRVGLGAGVRKKRDAADSEGDEAKTHGS